MKPPTQIPIVLGYRAASFLAGLKKPGLRGKFTDKAQYNAQMLGLMVNDPDILPEELAENTDPDFINMKKLVIAGDKDMIRDAHTRLIYANLPNAEIRVLHGTHFIAREKYREFNRAVESFLEK